MTGKPATGSRRADRCVCVCVRLSARVKLSRVRKQTLASWLLAVGSNLAAAPVAALEGETDKLADAKAEATWQRRRRQLPEEQTTCVNNLFSVYERASERANEWPRLIIIIYCLHCV